MKNRIPMRLQLLFACLAFLPALVSATHNRAGEIIVRAAGCANPSDRLTACATIITYTETAQTDVDRESLELDWGDGSSEMISRTSITPLASGVQRNEYTLCHRYAAFGRYVLSFVDVNRVVGVRNIPNSRSIPFSVYTSYSLVNPVLGGCNSSPEMTQDPIDNTCIGSVWTHNPGAFDVDGDSLAFEFTTPSFSAEGKIPNYVLPNLVAGAKGSLTIDERTGQITWDSPTATGEYNITIMVKSFRDGLALDTLVRDLQVFVDDCMNEPPSIDIVQEDISVVAGEVVEFEVVTSNPSSEDQQITLSAGGYPLMLATDPATFLSEGNVQFDPNRKIFRWVTTTADISKQEYFVVFRAEDDGDPAPTGLATVRTVSIKVVAALPTGLPELFPSDGGISVEVYPNPTADQLNVKLPVGEGPYDLEVYSPSGQRLLMVGGVGDRYSLSVGGLAAGAYFLVVGRDGRLLARRRVVVR